MRRLGRTLQALQPSAACTAQPGSDDAGCTTTSDDEHGRDPGGSLHPLPTWPGRDPAGATAVGLTAEEVEQFRRTGYLIKRRLIPPVELEPFVQRLWRQPPAVAAGLSPDDPSSCAPAPPSSAPSILPGIWCTVPLSLTSVVGLRVR
jgi:hypothetical protein